MKTKQEDNSLYVTTQKTGKGVKAAGFVSLVLFIVGMVWLDDPTTHGMGSTLIWIAVLTFIISRIVKWWRYS